MEKDPRGSKIDFNKISPEGYWTVGPGQTRPIVKFSLDTKNVKNYGFGKSLLLDHGIVEIKYEDCMCNKSKYMHLPIFFWKKRANFFFDEDLIDLGILSQNDITSEYHLTLQNSYHKPAVI